ncbi:hypothetical protein SFMTTN_0586 [Sulfuriferula multivorans]|uniref:DUF4426 domain-containing protein n=1 Tax=Sulfuriferula multivorans TaxID=1559896 RepID=A0A401JAT1_9PROT|nr:DUF4426 domain-containing protein [Sulfuriferula multivorans]GBL44785.1 hypothetical protein SFMTTN_0586 [Sulfuriferula multivorans]
MNIFANFTLVASLLALPFAAHAAQTNPAEQVVKYGNIEIHYNAMPTDELQPEVAKNYHIERSRNRGLLTIAVLRKNKLGVSEPVSAVITATVVNLNSQLAEIDMRTVKEGSAVYYLGEFRITPPDTLKFNVSAKPAGETRKYQAEFSRPFFQ